MKFWYTNPGHDLIMTLSALQAKLPFGLAWIPVRNETVHSNFSPDLQDSIEREEQII
jgi:hypothetical protein